MTQISKKEIDIYFCERGYPSSFVKRGIFVCVRHRLRKTMLIDTPLCLFDLATRATWCLKLKLFNQILGLSHMYAIFIVLTSVPLTYAINIFSIFQSSCKAYYSIQINCNLLLLAFVLIILFLAYCCCCCVYICVTACVYISVHM